MIRVAELVLHPQQLAGLALQQPPGRDAGPGRDDVGDVVRADFLLDHGRLAGIRRRRVRRSDRAALASASSCSSAGISPYSSREAASKSPSRWARSAWPSQVVEPLLQLADPVQAGLLLLPAARSARSSCSCRSARSARSRSSRSLLAASVSLRERQLLHLHPVDGALQLVDLDRPGVDLHPQPGRGLVDQVDGLVRQEPGGDVAVGQRRPRRPARRRRSAPCGAPRSGP